MEMICPKFCITDYKMNLLIINAGSSTIKYKVFTANEHEEIHPHSIVSGVIERRDGKLEITLYKASDIHKWQVEETELNNSAHLILKELDSISIDKIGFRIVHGGEKYTEPTLLNANVIADIEQISSLAPLHNPPALEKIREFMILLPQVPKYAVFDTAFHTTMPAKAYLYGLPYELYSKYKNPPLWFPWHFAPLYLFRAAKARAPNRARDHLPSGRRC